MDTLCFSLFVLYVSLNTAERTACRGRMRHLFFQNKAEVHHRPLYSATTQRCCCNWIIFLLHCPPRAFPLHICHKKPSSLPSDLNGMSILSVRNGDRGNVLNTGSHKHKVKCRHQSEDQSHRSFANQRIIITDFLAKPSQQLNMKGLVALSCAHSLSYHHLFPSLH